VLDHILSHLDRFSFDVARHVVLIGVELGQLPDGETLWPVLTVARRVVLDHIVSHLDRFSFDFARHVVLIGVELEQPPDGDALACAGGQSPSIRTPAHAAACLASAWDGSKQLEWR
jgi:hypothetical protein